MARKHVPLKAAPGSSAAEDFVNGAPDMRGKAEKPAEKEFRLNVIIGPDRSRALKILAASRGQTVKEIVIEMLDRELAAHG
ncbi:hypothetical protein [Rhizobium leguminosarum]|uniref:hypothetical protein n=1 Tax=Rhizobium leguminosarum TaxID=384 RepID=UPI003F99F393